MKRLLSLLAALLLPPAPIHGRGSGNHHLSGQGPGRCNGGDPGRRSLFRNAVGGKGPFPHRNRDHAGLGGRQFLHPPPFGCADSGSGKSEPGRSACRGLGRAVRTLNTKTNVKNGIRNISMSPYAVLPFIFPPRLPCGGGFRHKRRSVSPSNRASMAYSARSSE